MSQAYFDHYMQTASQFAKLGFGKHAPWIDVVNSLEHDGLGRTTDHLGNSLWLDGLLQRWQFPAPPEAAPLASLRQLRETLHRGAEGLAARGTLDKETLREINAAVIRAPTPIHWMVVQSASVGLCSQRERLSNASRP